MAIIFRCKFVISNHISLFSALAKATTSSPVARNSSPHRWRAYLVQAPAKPVTWARLAKRDLDFINVATSVIAVTVADNHQQTHTLALSINLHNNQHHHRYKQANQSCTNIMREISLSALTS